MNTPKFALPALGAVILLISALACNIPFLSSSSSTTTEGIPAAIATEVASTMNARLTVTAQGTPVAPAAPSTAEMTVVAHATATSTAPEMSATAEATQPPAAPAQPTATLSGTIDTINPITTPTLVAPILSGGVPTVVPIFPPTVMPTFIAVPTVVGTFIVPPTVQPTFLSVPTVIGKFLTVPTVVPTFLNPPTIVPTIISAPTIVPTGLATQVPTPTATVTIISVPTIVPTYVTPPAATPTLPSISSAGFSLINTNLNWCNGIPWAIFVVYNASGDTLESLELYLQDISAGVGLYGPTTTNTPFMASDKTCSTGGDSLYWGGTSYIGGPLGSGDLKGHTLRATIRLCSKENLGGKCFQKVVEFVIP